MKSVKKQNHISRQLEEIQSFLKQKDQKPLNFVEAAQYLSISQSTLYKLTYQRKIPAHKPSGKLLYFFKHELDGWITKSGELKVMSDELKNEKGKTGNGRRKKRNGSRKRNLAAGSAPLTTGSIRVTKKKKRNGSRKRNLAAGSTPLTTGALGVTEEEEPP
jgi:excisionase family DNA binding protein